MTDIPAQLAGLQLVTQGIRFVLDNNLQHRSTGRDPKVSGFEFAELPSWQLRQWLSHIEAVSARITKAEAS